MSVAQTNKRLLHLTATHVESFPRVKCYLIRGGFQRIVTNVISRSGSLNADNKKPIFALDGPFMICLSWPFCALAVAY
jgi:hypothetical protein